MPEGPRRDRGDDVGTEPQGVGRPLRALDRPRAGAAGHDAVLALLEWLPDDVEVDAALVADLLDVPEAEAARFLDELEAAWLRRQRDGSGPVATEDTRDAAAGAALVRRASPFVRPAFSASFRLDGLPPGPGEAADRTAGLAPVPGASDVIAIAFVRDARRQMTAYLGLVVGMVIDAGAVWSRSSPTSG